MHQGIAHAPEGRRLFGTLTVAENLMLGAFTRSDAGAIARTEGWVLELFPALRDRRQQLAGTLSGGEQQMLAIARALMAEPRLLLLDEPSLGLAPLVVKTIFRTIREINQARGVTIVLVEQNARAALRLAHRGYVMEVGRMVLEDSAAALAFDLTYLATRQAKRRSAISASVGARLVTTLRSAAPIMPASRSWTRRPPATVRTVRLGARGSGRPPARSRRRFFFAARMAMRLVAGGRRDDHLGEDLGDLGRGRFVERAVQRDDAAEGGDRIAAERQAIGLGEGRRRWRRRTGWRA